MDDPVKLIVSGNEINDLSEESGCIINHADATCEHKEDFSGLQSESSKKLLNSSDINENSNKFEDFNVSGNNVINDDSSELSNYEKTEDCNLVNHPTFVDQNDKEILSKDAVHLHDEDVLPEGVNLHGEKEILENQHNVDESLFKNDEDILPKDVVQHDEVSLSKDVNLHHDEILLNDVVIQHNDQHNVEESLFKDDVVLDNEDILPNVIDQHDEVSLSKDVDLHNNEIFLNNVVDQQNEVILSNNIDEQIDNATLPKDVEVVNDNSCDFLPKDDVDPLNGVDHPCDANALDSQEHKHIQKTDENSLDSLSSDSCSPQKLETESSHSRIYKSREKNALPYFQLPKPDLEEFLIETDKKLHESEIKNPNVLHEVEVSKSQTSKEQFIVFEIGPATPMDKFKNKFMNQTKLHADPSPRVSSKSFQGLQINSPLLSKDMEEKDSPGFKRLVLKEYLKQKIDEKKVAAFNRFKEASKLDEEEEMYVDSDDSEGSVSDDESNEFQKRLEKMMAPKENIDVSELEGDKETPENVEIETVDLEPAGDDSDDEDFFPNEISKKDKIVSEDHDSFHSDSEESEDEIMFSKKSKQCKRLIDDSDEESDFNSVSYGCSQNKNKTGEMKNLGDMSEDNSLDSVNATSNGLNNECESVSSISSSNQNVNLEENNTVQESYENEKHSKDYFTATPGISSSAIPSYQPGGGFQSEESSDSSNSICSGSKSIDGNKLKKGNSDSSFSSSQNFVGNRSLSSTLNNPLDDIRTNNQFIGEYSINKTPAFGVSLDDLPISQEDSDMFASQDVDNICSGIFQDSAPLPSLLEESILKLKYPDISVATEKVEDFLDAEAELSGEDDGLDDDSGDEGNEVNDIIAADDDLPSDEELRDGIADLYMKRIHDDDDMQIKKVQEHFLDDGELNTDGAGRSRRFQWKNDEIENNDQHDMSESDNEEPDENWNALNREKAKWQQENVKQMTEDLSSEEFVKKTTLKMKILGKPNNLIGFDNALPTLQKRKRPRGSLFNLDDGSASQVLKKLKAAEDSSGGSRTTKHFVFRNDVVSEVVAVTKEVAVTFSQQTSSTHVEVGELSVFDNI